MNYSYIGDSDLQNGGLFFELPDDMKSRKLDYVSCVEVYSGDYITIMSGIISLYMDDYTTYESVLDTCGYTPVYTGDDESWPDIVDCMGERHITGTVSHYILLVDSFNAYRGIEADSTSEYRGKDSYALADYVKDNYGYSQKDAVYS